MTSNETEVKTDTRNVKLSFDCVKMKKYVCVCVYI